MKGFRVWRGADEVTRALSKSAGEDARTKFEHFGQQLDDWRSYFVKYDASIAGLDCFLIQAGHADYYMRYREKGFTGLTELGSMNSNGHREGIIKLADNIIIGFVLDRTTRYQYTVGFAKTEEALAPHLLRTTTHRVFTSNYNAEILPHEIKDPPAVIFLADGLLEKFQRDISAFLGGEEFYKKVNRPRKRGALLYGNPGNGKTSLITWAAQKFDKVFSIDPDDANTDLARNINLLCRPEETKIIILEDLDSLNEHTSDLLNFVDGSILIPNAYYIGTTNYPERLHENILSRPSRFDLFMEIPRPDRDTREKLLRHHIPDQTDARYAELAELTVELNASYFQEIVTIQHSYEFIGETITIEEIINECKKRVQLNKTKKFDQKDGAPGFGFNR